MILLALGLGAFLLYLFLFRIDIFVIFDKARGMDFSLYLLAMSCVVFDTFFFAMSWRSLLNFLAIKLSVVKSFLYVWYGVFMDIVIPAESISGEISRVYLVTREQDGTHGKVVASLVAHRLMGMAINVASLFIGIFLLLIGGQLYGMILTLLLFLAVATSVALVLLLSLCLREKWTLRLIDGLMKLASFLSRGRWKLTSVKDEALRATTMFHDSFKEYMRSPRTLVASFFLSMISWIFAVGAAYFVFLSLRVEVPLSAILVTTTIVAAVKSIPIGVPFEMGLPEITMSGLFSLLSPSLTLETALTATLLIRVLTLWMRFFIGFAAQQWLEIRPIKRPFLRPSATSLEKV
jgi:uncharacterized protein (TIRG00374 family)